MGDLVWASRVGLELEKEIVMRVEVRPDGKFEIQISKYNDSVWVLSKEAAMQLATWIIELAGETGDVGEGTLKRSNNR